MLFVLNENPIVWAMALSKVEFTGGRYIKAGDRYDDAYDLLLEIDRNGHQIALSCELWDNYANWRSRLQTSGIASSPHPIDVILGLWQRPDRVVFDPVPPVVPLPANFPGDDRYLAHLAVAANAMLVTEDEGVLAAAAGGALGFDAVSIADALLRARAPE